MIRDYIVIERDSYMSYLYMGSPEKGLPVLIEFLVNQPHGDAEYYERRMKNPPEDVVEGDVVDMRWSDGVVTLSMNQRSWDRYPYTFAVPVGSFVDMLKRWWEIFPSQPQTIYVERRGNDVAFKVGEEANFQSVDGGIR